MAGKRNGKCDICGKFRSKCRCGGVKNAGSNREVKIPLNEANARDNDGAGAINVQSTSESNDRDITTGPDDNVEQLFSSSNYAPGDVRIEFEETKRGETIPIPGEVKKTKEEQLNPQPIIEQFLQVADMILSYLEIPNGDAQQRKMTAEIIAQSVEIEVVDKAKLKLDGNSALMFAIAGYFAPRVLQSPKISKLIKKFEKKELREQGRDDGKVNSQ